MPSSGTWPASLPQRLPVGTTIRREGNIVATGMAGARKVRRRFTAVPTFLEPPSRRFLIAEDQITTLLAFHDDDMVDGTLSFDWFGPMPGFELVEVRFVQRPLVQSVTKTVYSVSVIFELLP